MQGTKVKRRNKGITLIALVVTIIVLLILVGVTLNLALGAGGIFTNARNAADRYQEAQTNEEEQMSELEQTFDKYNTNTNTSINEDEISYIVIYTDGYDGSIFEDQTYIVYKSDNEDKEPQFNEDGSYDENHEKLYPERDGFVFDDWIKSEKTLENKRYVTYTAKWIPEDEMIVIITWNPDNGEPNMTRQIGYKDSEPAAPPNPTKNGYIFAGWSRSVSREGNKVYITYIAQWMDSAG